VAPSDISEVRLTSLPQNRAARPRRTRPAMKEPDVSSRLALLVFDEVAVAELEDVVESMVLE